jgi:hypothetical protein
MMLSTSGVMEYLKFEILLARNELNIYEMNVVVQTGLWIRKINGSVS